MIKIEPTIFAKPSGNVRGIVIAMVDDTRVAHAYLNTDGTATITLDKVRGKPSLEYVTEIANALTMFAKEVGAH